MIRDAPLRGPGAGNLLGFLTGGGPVYVLGIADGNGKRIDQGGDNVGFQVLLSMGRMPRGGDSETRTQ